MAQALHSDVLTVVEAARLAGVSVRKIEKACEEGIVKKRKFKGTLLKRQVYHVPAETVAYTAALKNCPNIYPNKSVKKQLWVFLRTFASPVESFGVANLGDGLLLDLDEMAGREWAEARYYMNARNRYLASSPRILGGEPVIKGTRITCRSVKGRVDGGDTLDELVEDYGGEVPREAFEVALAYANNHPPRGRPSAGKPWRKQKAGRTPS